MNAYTVRKIVITLASVIIGASIIAYAYYQSRAFITGPTIEISSPTDGQTVYEALIKIEGMAVNVARIELNGNQIFVDENNSFNEKLLLLNGYNIITLRAVDKFKREVQKDIEITLQEESSI